MFASRFQHPRGHAAALAWASLLWVIMVVTN